FCRCKLIAGSRQTRTFGRHKSSAPGAGQRSSKLGVSTWPSASPRLTIPGNGLLIGAAVGADCGSLEPCRAMHARVIIGPSLPTSPTLKPTGQQGEELPVSGDEAVGPFGEIGHSR